MDGITVVRELATENKHGSDIVVDGMNKLTDHNGQLQSRTASSQEMTGDINSQVQNVASMINDMVSLTAESGKHAKQVPLIWRVWYRLPERWQICPMR